MNFLNFLHHSILIVEWNSKFYTQHYIADSVFLLASRLVADDLIHSFEISEWLCELLGKFPLITRILFCVFLWEIWVTFRVRFWFCWGNLLSDLWLECCTAVRVGLHCSNHVVLDKIWVWNAAGRKYLSKNQKNMCSHEVGLQLEFWMEWRKFVGLNTTEIYTKRS